MNVNTHSYNYGAANPGYSGITPVQFIPFNDGNVALSGVTAVLDSGADFEITAPLSGTALPVGGSLFLYVRPKTGLSIGTHSDTLTITATEIAPATVTVSLSFEVAKLSQDPLAVINPGTKTFGDAAFQLAATGGSGTGAVTYYLVSGPASVTDAGAVTITGAGTVTVNAVKAADANYNAVTSANCSFTVNKANPSVTWPTGLTVEQGKLLSNIPLPGNGTANVAGTFTWTAPSTSVGSAGVKSFSMTFTPSNTANYNTVNNNVSVTVVSAGLSDPTMGGTFKVVAYANASGTIQGWAGSGKDGSTKYALVATTAIDAVTGTFQWAAVSDRTAFNTWWNSTCPQTIKDAAVVPTIPGDGDLLLWSSITASSDISKPTDTKATSNAAFALSAKEVATWGSYTDQGHHNGAAIGTGTGSWWTRSNQNASMGVYVMNDGGPNNGWIGGAMKTSPINARPALWVKVAP